MMPRRIRNSPTVQEIIREFLGGRTEPASNDEIFRHVVRRATLISEKPRASVFSVLTRMPDVARFQRGKYMLISSKEPK